MTTQPLQISLGSSIVGVTGTVNGVAVDFLLIAPQLWETEAAKASDGRYFLDLNLETDLGTIYNYKITEYYYDGWSSPVYDRLQSDVVEKTDKGYLNASDLNRIEFNCRYLADTLDSLGYNIVLVTKVNWLRTDMPWISDIERIKDNVLRLIDVFCNAEYSPDLPADLTRLTHLKLNDIEKNLYDIKQNLDNMLKIVRYSGTFYSGGTHYGVNNN